MKKESNFYIKEFQSLVIDKSIIKEIIPEISDFDSQVLLDSLILGLFDTELEKLIKNIYNLNKSILNMEENNGYRTDENR